MFCTGLSILYICIPVSAECSSLSSFFFVGSPSVLFVSFNSCRVLAAHSHTLTPKCSLSHRSVNRPDFHSSSTVNSAEKKKKKKHHTDTQVWGEIGAISLSISNSVSLSCSRLFSQQPANKNQTNNSHEVTASNKDTNYSLKFLHHFRANGYLTYKMTQWKVLRSAQEHRVPLCMHMH